MHGVSKTVTPPVTFSGKVKGPRGGTVAGFEIETKLDRKDYGIVWNKALDAGGMILGDEIDITINLETKGE
jgi:polyisoprenoid-binding protein YceI